MATAKAEEASLLDPESDPDSPELCELVSELDVVSPPVVVVVKVEPLVYYSISVCPANNDSELYAYIGIAHARRSTRRLASSVGTARTSLRTRAGIRIRGRSVIGRVVSGGSLITHQPPCDVANSSYACYSQKPHQNRSMQSERLTTQHSLPPQ